MSENYADPSDLASRHEELFLDLALKVKKPEGPKATGSCLWCDEVVEADRRWCDSDCRDAFEKFGRR